MKRLNGVHWFYERTFNLQTITGGRYSITVNCSKVSLLMHTHDTASHNTVLMLTQPCFKLIATPYCNVLSWIHKDIFKN